jgi:DNA-binding MarR family transcriptional regulator
MIGSAAMSNRLENLAVRGLVVRKGNPRDGRSNLARLTAEGAERVDSAMIALVESEARELQSLSRPEQTQLVALLRKLAGDGGADRT